MSTGRMTMNAVVEVDTASGTDPYGHPVSPVYQEDRVEPCWAWSETAKVAVGDELKCFQTIKAIFQLDSGITAGDRIARVENRLGEVIYQGPMSVQFPEYKHRHIEVMLERATG